jgi:hypothetical protein
MPLDNSFNNARDNIVIVNEAKDKKPDGWLTKTNIIVGIIVSVISILAFFGITQYQDLLPLFRSSHPVSAASADVRILGTWTDGREEVIFAPNGGIYSNGRKQGTFAVIGENKIKLDGIAVADLTVTDAQLIISRDGTPVMVLKRVSDRRTP